MAKQNNNPARKNEATAQPQQRAQLSNTAEAQKSSLRFERNDELIFGRQNFLWMVIGAALILGGMLCMLGGAMPSPDVWDKDIIYSFRIVTLAPILILVGIVVEIYAIFKD